MKCDLCKHQAVTETLLCGNCADMVRRLVAIDLRMHAREICEAERLAGISTEARSTASGRSM